MRVSILAAAALAALALTTTAASGAAAPTTLSALDKHYLMASTQSSCFEVASGVFAATHWKNAAVRTIGLRLAADHAKALATGGEVSRSVSLNVKLGVDPVARWA